MLSIQQFYDLVNGDGSNYVYHYTRPGSFASILSSGEFWLGTFGNLNDPRENRQWIARDMLSPAGIMDDEWRIRSGELIEYVDRFLRRCARVGCFTETREDGPSGALSYGWARPAQWVHYGGGHAGACLVFDRALLYQFVHDAAATNVGTSRAFRGVVEYGDGRLTIPYFGAPESVAQLRNELDAMLDDTELNPLKKLYLEKNSDWASEREWRIVVLSHDLPDASLDRPLQVPWDGALVGVVVGEAFAAPGSIGHAIGDLPALRCTWDAGVAGLRDLTT
jgi:hypothetical protein